MRYRFFEERAGGLLLHGFAITIIIVIISLVYLHFNSMPKGSTWLEAEDFSFSKETWIVLGDVNFSGSRGLMTGKTDAPASVSFKTAEDGEQHIWIKYFGNHGPHDLALWRRAYTNSFKYIDLFGSTEPLELAVQIDDGPSVIVKQEGRHRYRWAQIPANLKAGEHTISFAKAGSSEGGVNIDGILITTDKGFIPGQFEMLPRQMSEFFAPMLIIGFPVAVWLYVRKERGRKCKAHMYMFYSILLSSILSVMWIDTDGGFWIWLTQTKEFTLASIYTQGDALHHRYVYPPPIAALLIGLRTVFSLFGTMDGITPLSLLLSKIIVIPFVIGTGVLLYKLEGNRGVFLWAFNSILIFTVAANSMYFGLAFLLLLCLYFVKKEAFYTASFVFGLAMAYMSAAALLLPPFLFHLRNFGFKQIVLMTLLAIAPGFLILIPYQIIDPAGLNLRVMGAGIATWMSMHLGLKLGGVGVTALLYGVLLSWLWLKKPELDYGSLSATFALSSLIYLNIGAPYFLAWTVAFQPFIIIWACRLRQEVFYSLYITALITWGSFFVNTGGADDRAGETGFFPYYVFYTWPFDIYQLVSIFYKKINYFSRVDLETLSHSISAGLSIVMLLMIAQRLGNEYVSAERTDA
ncbi:MAG: hypothetical protein HYS21_06230 [Deltaproteobacteria bacterium]|nr:hypothetical protein [Deltaproteobacteria bacterium]